jgi:Uncharacterized conserved protein
MDNDIKTWIYDILQSIKEVESYYSDKPKKFEEYVSDFKTKRAVERNIEIIGEAYPLVYITRETIFPMLQNMDVYMTGQQQ